MKVAIVLGGFPIVSETFILNQITGLYQMGIDFRIIAQIKENSPTVHEDVNKYDLMEKLFVLPETKIGKILSLIKYFFKAPIKILKNLYFFYRNTSCLSYAFGLMEQKYEIIYCHFGTFGSDVAELKKRKIIKKSKLYTVFHGYDMSNILFERGDNYYAILKKYGDLFLPISNLWAKKLVELGFDKNKIIVHRMGIDISKFQFVLRNTQKNQTKLLSVCRFAEKKGLEYGIRALHLIKNQKLEYHYTIAGYGPLEEDLKQLVKDLGLEKSISFLGPQNSFEVLELMKQADIFILPSITASDGDMEGIPVVLMEAMATGLPVVSSFHSGIPELVEHEITGYLCNERDTEALALSISKLITQLELRLEMGQKGRKKVEKEYNIELLNRELVNLLMKV